MIEEFPLEQFGTVSDDYMADIAPSGYTEFSWAFDNFISRENPVIAGYNLARYHFEDSEVIDKETWENEYQREGTNWFEGMTFYQAEVVRDEADYQRKLQWATPEISFASISGAFLASAFDPLNYLPWTRMMGATVKAAGIGTTFARSVGDGVVGATIGEVPIYHNKKATQVEYDLNHAMLNIAMAGATGATFAGMPRVAKLLKEKNISETSGAGAKALTDTAEGKSVEIDQSAPTKETDPLARERELELKGLEETLKKEEEILMQNSTIKTAYEQGKDFIDAAKNFFNCKF